MGLGPFLHGNPAMELEKYIDLELWRQLQHTHKRTSCSYWELEESEDTCLEDIEPVLGMQLQDVGLQLYQGMGLSPFLYRNPAKELEKYIESELWRQLQHTHKRTSCSYWELGREWGHMPRGYSVAYSWGSTGTFQIQSGKKSTWACSLRSSVPKSPCVGNGLAVAVELNKGARKKKILEH